MEDFFSFFIKLIVIFLGGGLLSLLVVWIAAEACTVSKLILNSELKHKEKHGLKLLKRVKSSSQSGFYEIFLPGGRLFKIFSSHTGMREV